MKNSTVRRIDVFAEGNKSLRLKKLLFKLDSTTCLSEKTIGIRLLTSLTEIIWRSLLYLTTDADIFCFSSVSETQGLVTMEAMAAGLPVAAVRGTGTTEIVRDGETGILTENSPADLAQAILNIIGDCDRYQKFQNNALQISKSFDIAVQAQKMINIYEQAIEDKKAGRTIKANLEALKQDKQQPALSV